jgi:hypothetical protein
MTTRKNLPACSMCVWRSIKCQRCEGKMLPSEHHDDVIDLSYGIKLIVHQLLYFTLFRMQQSVECLV